MPPLSTEILASLYDATILLSIGLTTVLGAIFAISTTFLGRSLQQAKEEIDTEDRRAETEYNETLARIRETRDGESPSDGFNRARKEVRDAEKTEKSRKRRLWRRKTFSGPGLLTVTGSVIFPGLLFVLAAVSSSIAKPLLQVGIQKSL